jgi:hypothetical protein
MLSWLKQWLVSETIITVDDEESIPTTTWELDEPERQIVVKPVTNHVWKPQLKLVYTTKTNSNGKSYIGSDLMWVQEYTCETKQQMVTEIYPKIKVIHAYNVRVISNGWVWIFHIRRKLPDRLYQTPITVYTIGGIRYARLDNCWCLVSSNVPYSKQEKINIGIMVTLVGGILTFAWRLWR